VNTARVYDPVRSGDGIRILVDRLWPRGIRKDDVRVGRWFKDVSPSNELRRWYGHDPSRFEEFARRYTAELAHPDAAAALDDLRSLVSDGPVTLVTATKELDLSHLAVLAPIVEDVR
jgi:uncharacterized protein YeaO (DUF488 family)